MSGRGSPQPPLAISTQLLLQTWVRPLLPAGCPACPSGCSARRPAHQGLCPHPPGTSSAPAAAQESQAFPCEPVAEGGKASIHFPAARCPHPQLGQMLKEVRTAARRNCGTISCFVFYLKSRLCSLTSFPRLCLTLTRCRRRQGQCASTSLGPGTHARSPHPCNHRENELKALQCFPLFGLRSVVTSSRAKSLFNCSRNGDHSGGRPFLPSHLTLARGGGPAALPCIKPFVKMLVVSPCRAAPAT